MDTQRRERRLPKSTRLLLAAGVVASYACGDSAVAPEPSVATIVVTPPAVQLFPADTARFTAEARSESGNVVAGVSFTWSSTRGDVVAVDASGLVTGLGAGTAKVIAAGRGRSGQADVEIKQRLPDPIESVEITPSDVDLVVGDTVRLSAVPRSFGGLLVDGGAAAWASDRVDVASVDTEGLVTTHAGGEANVTATVQGVAGSARVRVAVPVPTTPAISMLRPQSIQAGWGSFTLAVHGSGFVPQSRVRWAGLPLETYFVSGSELQAVVSSWYVATEGVAEVTVETPLPESLVSNAWTFTIFSPPAFTVDLLVPGNAVLVGDRVRLDAVARDQFGQVIEGKTITWSSSDTTVARVEGDFVHGLRLGSVNLVAAAEPTFSGMTLSVVESPVGSLVFEAAPAGGKELFIRSLDPAGAVRRLLPPMTTARQAAITVDGSRIAFVGKDATGNEDIWVMNADGSDLERLTNDPALDDQPAWSPDGLSIAFRSFRQGKSDVWVMNADGSDQRNLTFAGVFFPEEYNDRPAWSPDGETLVFSRGFGTGQALYKIGADGSGMAQFVAWSGLDLLEPSWSQDGTLIAFRRFDRAQNRSSVELVDGSTGELAYFFWRAPVNSLSPTILPDGWVAVSAPVLPGTTIRTVALVRLAWGHVVVPMGAEYGELGEPAALPR